MSREALTKAVALLYPRFHLTADDHVKGVTLTGKNIVVTGCTSGIGIPTAVALARTGANVYVTGRQDEVLRKVVDDIKRETKNENVRPIHLDLSDFASVRAAAEEIKAIGTLDILIHNAGVMACPFSLTKDGFELQVQVNVLSVVLLTELVKPVLSPTARVVIVSSLIHKMFFTGNPATLTPLFKAQLAMKEPTNYNDWHSYAVVKSAEIMYAVQLNREFVEAGKSIRVLALHPGSIPTDLQRHIDGNTFEKHGLADSEGPGPLMKTVPEGAATTVWCAVAPELEGVGGVYAENNTITEETNYGTTTSTDPAVQQAVALSGTAAHVWIKADQAEVTQLARSAVGL